MSENLLRHETSPYLLQHKDNPVHWRPWGQAAFAEARAENKPILLSVGYSACHWCHVMAHESFENPDIAALMNELFVSIKVDREERPDVDQLYMSGLQALGGRGGWPLTVFLTPQGQLYWGGTYFPPTARFGRAGFPDILRQAAGAYRDQPDRVAQNARKSSGAMAPSVGAGSAISLDLLDETAGALVNNFDPINGGLKGGPKFPQASLFEFIWRTADRSGNQRFRSAFLLTMRRICEGGIFDHVGGGFARYSVDERWHVPHFEKMLYDNGQLLRLLALAWKASGEPLFAERIEQTIGWLEREMLTVDGAFASSQDADSEGVEGKYYVWTKTEFDEIFGADAAAAASAYGVTEAGNWEHVNVLHRLDGASADATTLAAIREKLMMVRARRTAPGRDDKALADWNGLAIEGICAAAVALDRPHWLTLARRAYDFVVTQMTVEGRVGHSARFGRVSRPGLSSDTAAMVAAALSLYEATAEKRFLDDALRMHAALDAFHYDERHGYYLTASDASDLVERPGGSRDDAMPNPNAVAAQNLVRLGLLTGEGAYLEKAERLFQIFGGSAVQEPFRHFALLNAFDFASRAVEAVIIGPITETDALAHEVFSYDSLDIVLSRAPSPDDAPRNSPAYGRPMIDGKPTAYVCREGVCSLPVVTPSALGELLRDGRPEPHGEG